MAAELSAGTRSPVVARVVIYGLLILFAALYLLPLYVMVVTSFKTLEEVRQGNMMAMPTAPTIAPWLSAWASMVSAFETSNLPGCSTFRLFTTPSSTSME